MNNEAPASTAALQARIADLEQQLKLSDEGVSRLAERCLGLEQEVQSYLAAHPQNEKHTDSPALLQPTRRSSDLPSILMRASAFRRKTPSPPRTMRWTS